MIRKLILLIAVALAYTSSRSIAFAVETTPPTRLSVRSPFYNVHENDLELFASYSWFNPLTEIAKLVDGMLAL